MLKGFIIGVFATILVAFAAGAVVIRGGWIPANADAVPSRLEARIAGTSLDATLDREAPRTPNPVAMTDANLQAGMDLYLQHCALCHGTATGDASASPVAKGLYPRPPQLASHGVEDDTEGVTFWKLQHGIRWSGMPSWNGTLDDQQMWTLALFLKHMDALPPAVSKAWQEAK